MSQARTFICAGCGYIYSTQSTVEEQQKEFLDMYNEDICDTEEPLVSVCDVCYDKVLKEKSQI
jgi:hypothetical protein